MLGPDAGKGHPTCGRRTDGYYRGKDIIEEKECTPCDWGRKIDLNIDEDEVDVPISTESADLLSTKA
jgi:hypothetical protein